MLPSWQIPTTLQISIEPWPVQLSWLEQHPLHQRLQVWIPIRACWQSRNVSLSLSFPLAKISESIDVGIFRGIVFSEHPDLGAHSFMSTSWTPLIALSTTYQPLILLSPSTDLPFCLFLFAPAPKAMLITRLLLGQTTRILTKIPKIACRIPCTCTFF